MTKLVNLKTFVVLSFVSTFISACGVPSTNMNQAGLSTEKTYGFTTLAETRTDAQIREAYLKAHSPAPSSKPVVKVETPKPVPTPVKTAEVRCEHYQSKV